MLTTRIDPEKSIDVNMTMGIRLPDVDAAFGLEIRRGVVQFHTRLPDKVDFTLVTARPRPASPGQHGAHYGPMTRERECRKAIHTRTARDARVTPLKSPVAGSVGKEYATQGGDKMAHPWR